MHDIIVPSVRVYNMLVWYEYVCIHSRLWLIPKAVFLSVRNDCKKKGILKWLSGNQFKKWVRAELKRFVSMVIPTHDWVVWNWIRMPTLNLEIKHYLHTFTQGMRGLSPSVLYTLAKQEMFSSIVNYNSFFMFINQSYSQRQSM